MMGIKTEPEDRIIPQFAKHVRISNKMRDSGKGSVGELSHYLHGLTEEAGETAGVLKKVTWLSGYDTAAVRIGFAHNKNEYADKMLKEMGDTLWYLQSLCNFFGITLDTLALLNTQKLCERHGDDWPFENVPLSLVEQLRLESMRKVVGGFRDNG